MSRFEEGVANTYPVTVPEMFTKVGRGGGREEIVNLSDRDLECAHAYVLRNCDYFRRLEDMHEEQIRKYNQELSDEEVTLKMHNEFPAWVKQYVIEYSRYCRRKKKKNPFPTWVHDLVDGPVTHVTRRPMYFTRGYLFHSRAHGERKRTMNYGVCVRGQNFSDASDEADFYGILDEIIELRYQGLVGLKITLFKCEWYDPTIGRGTRLRDGGRIVDVRASRRYHKYEPFILESQADQVCYIPYPTKKSRAIWLNVMRVNPRATIVGKFVHKDLVLLQQEDDSEVTPVEVIQVGALIDETNPDDFIDNNVRDEEAADEFQCNLSSSDDDEDAAATIDDEA